MDTRPYDPDEVGAHHGASAHTLVVRIWFEATRDEGTEGEWRGQVKDVMTRRAVYFRSLDRLERAVSQLLTSEEKLQP